MVLAFVVKFKIARRIPTVVQRTCKSASATDTIQVTRMVRVLIHRRHQYAALVVQYKENAALIRIAANINVPLCHSLTWMDSRSQRDNARHVETLPQPTDEHELFSLILEFLLIRHTNLPR
jgi:hypothetical protein